jgi:hypothetical protein
MGCGSTKPIHVEPIVPRQVQQQQQQQQQQWSASPISSSTPLQSTNGSPLREPTQQQVQRLPQQQQHFQSQAISPSSSNPQSISAVTTTATIGHIQGSAFPVKENGISPSYSPNNNSSSSNNNNIQPNGGMMTTTTITNGTVLPSLSSINPHPIIVAKSTTTTQGSGSSSSRAHPPNNYIRPVGIDDPQWQELYLSHTHLILDPSDVHSTLHDLMGRSTNRLSQVEVLYLQRRVRSIVRQSQIQAEQSKTTSRKPRLPFNTTKDGNNNNNTGNGNSQIIIGGNGGGGGGGGGNGGSGGHPINSLQNVQDTKAIKEKYHLLTRYVISRILPRLPPSSSAATTGPSSPTPPTTTTTMNGSGLVSTSANGGSNRSLSSLGGNNSNHGTNNGHGGNSNNNNHNNNNSGSTNDHNSNEYGTIHIVDTVYLLASYCHDSLWDGVAEIAVQSAKVAGIEMDVNKKKATLVVAAAGGGGNGGHGNNNGPNNTDNHNTAKVPKPVPPTREQTPDVLPGVGLQALTFILGLALRTYIRHEFCVCVYMCRFGPMDVSNMAKNCCRGLEIIFICPTFKSNTSPPPPPFAFMLSLHFPLLSIIRT